jgi:NADPH2:quinone reductase
MHAIQIESHGGADVLQYKEVEDPTPGDGQVLVEVEAAGVNYRDVYEREGSGAYGGEVPRIVGVEGAGRVADSGEHVAWIAAPGSYAERVAADRDRLVHVPDGVASDVAAAALLQGMTAHFLASDAYPIQPGDWVLVHAAAGGVGLLLTQIARLRGGRVIATTSTGEKAQLAREAGAEEVIGYEGFAQRVREITEGDGVAAVYDGVGKSTFLEGLDALRPTGRLILFGAASGQPDPLELPLLAAKGSLYVQRPTLNTYARTPELMQERAASVFELLADDRLDVRIGARYPLAEARQAHEDLEARRTTGKLVLLPGQ